LITDERQTSQVTRSLYFTADPSGALALATSMEHAIVEVLAVPEDYADETALTITETVHKAGILDVRARAGTRGGPVRITWAALVEKGIDAGVLEQVDG
jgi:hypothetical protein